MKFKDGRGGKGNLRWQTKNALRSSNEATNAIYTNTKLDPNTVIILEDGNILHFLRQEEKGKIQHCVNRKGDMKDRKLISDLRMKVNKFLSRN